MKRSLLVAVFFLSSVHSFSQDFKNEDLITIGKYYSNFMFTNSAPKSVSKKFGKGIESQLKTTVSFIKEITKENNKILTNDFLKLPDNATLKAIYIVDALHQIPHKKVPTTPNHLVDSLEKLTIPHHELVDQYYSTLFTSVGNKNKPFDLSKVNFDLDAYSLSNDRLKGIFFLRCMGECHSQIFGFMNIVQPPNTEKALGLIEKFPTFNELQYYQYTDLHFEDFEMEIYNDAGLKSYKSHFIDLFYSTLFNHLICLDKEEKGAEEIRNLLLGSILRDESLWKYTSHKEMLESIFQEEER